MLQKIWDLAEENLTTKAINKLLLATDDNGRTVLHKETNSYDLEILREVLKWAKKN